MPDKRTSNDVSGENNPADLSDELADLLASISPKKSANAAGNAASNAAESRGSGELTRRKRYRHPVRWRVAIVNKDGDRNDIYHGRTYDVSLSGISVLLDRNMLFTSEVVLLLAIPPMHQGQKETIIEIQCRLTHTVLDSEHSQFRLGMKFIHFKGDGQRILSDILSKRHIPKQAHSFYTSI